MTDEPPNPQGTRAKSNNSPKSPDTSSGTKDVSSGSQLSIDRVDGKANTEELMDVLKSESRSPTTPEKSFELRKKRPNVIDFITSQVRIPTTQRKRILPIIETSLDRKIDIKSNHDFYNALLDCVEKRPSRILHLALMSSSQNTSDSKITGANFSKAVHNFAPTKLAIKVIYNRKKIIKKFDEDGISSLSNEEVVGIFFNYGITYGPAFLSRLAKSEREASIKSKTKEEKNDESKKGLVTIVSELMAEHRLLLDKLQFETKVLHDSYDLQPMVQVKNTVDDILAWQKRYHEISNMDKINAILSEVMEDHTEISEIESEKREDIIRAVASYAEIRSEFDRLDGDLSDAKEKINEFLKKDNFKKAESFSKKAKSLKAEVNSVASDLDSALNEVRKLILDIVRSSPKEKEDIRKISEDRVSTEAAPPTRSLPDEKAKDIASKEIDIEESKRQDTKSKKENDDKPKKLTPKEQKAFCQLLQNGQIGIVARYARALERRNKALPVSSECLKFAATSRISFRSIDPSTPNFIHDISSVDARVANNQNESAMVAGSLLRISILQPKVSSARSTLARLSLGSFSGSIGGLVQEISNLEYTFNPTYDELSYAADKSEPVSRSAIEEELVNWRRGLERGSQPVLFRIFIGSDSEFGTVMKSLQRSSKSVPEDQIRDVIKNFESREYILGRIKAVRASKGLSSKELHTRNQVHIYRRLEEGASLLRKWLETYETEARKSTHETRAFMQTVRKLRTQAKKAIELLEAQEQKSGGVEASICRWLVAQMEEFALLLSGGSGNIYANIDAALHDEVDLIPLPNNFFESRLEASDCDSDLISFLSKKNVPSAEEAIVAHGESGSFRKAARLLRGIKDSEKRKSLEKRINDHRRSQSDKIGKRIRECTSSLMEVGRFDVDHHEKVYQNVDLLLKITDDLKLEEETSLEMLADLRHEDVSGDVGNANHILSQIEKFISDRQSSIRNDQMKELEDLKVEKPKQAKEIGALINDIHLKKLDYIEDQIALIRDDRAIGSASTEGSDIFDAFFPHFVKLSEAEDWPKGYDGFSAALESYSPLAVSADRQEAGRRIFKDWFDLEKTVSASKPSTESLRSLFGMLSFQSVELRRRTQIQNNLAWTYSLSMKVPDDPNRSWFIPPAFGTHSKNRYAAIVMHPDVLTEQIRPALKSDMPTFIVVAGRLSVERRRDMANQLRQQNIAAIVLDETMVAFIASRRDDRLRVLFDCGLAFGRIEPYITAAGKLPPEMFFGREQEITKIVGRDAEGILVYGGRQLGKSALLAQVEELHHRPKDGRIVIREDIKTFGTSAVRASEIWKIIANKLREFEVVSQNSKSRDKIVSDIQAWISRNPNGRVLCLFDETDNFLESEAKNDFPNLVHIKSLMENTDRAFKAVFAGLHHVQRMFKAPNSPLAHFGTEICVGPLNRTRKDLDAAYRLIVAPMRAAGFRFNNPNAPYEILSYVNHYPSLMQVYAKELISHLHGLNNTGDGPLWSIPDEILFNGEGFEKIEAGIRRKFSYTLDLDPRYKLIAYVLGDLKWLGRDTEVMQEGLTAQEIREETLEHWPSKFERIPLADMHTILDEMYELGVLGKIKREQGSTTYCLRTRQVAKMLGSAEEIIEGLLALEDIEPPVDFNPITHRKIFSGVSDLGKERDARHISPLTVSQLSTLVEPEEDSSGIRIVAGISLLGLANVGEAIEDYVKSREANVRYDQIDVKITRSEKEYSNCIRNQAQKRDQLSIVIAGFPKFAVTDKLIKFTESHPSVTTGSIRPILVLDSSNPESRHVAIRRGAIYLRPWGEEMLRTYLALVEIDDKRSLREVILRKTGGIANEIIPMLSKLRRSAEDYVLEAEHMDPAHVDGIVKGNENLAVAADVLVQAADLVSDVGGDIRQVYEIADQDILNKTGDDLETLGYDLLALGVLDIFEPENNTFRVTYLGRLLARQSDLTSHEAK